ncbi:hypothetical protein I302_104144 [Kwoniella bestiolae CBS 10118]|uniref:SET domain-containing protein n=1 Tax=Kwoniella bestiolae CBS 10118 TaxID=1296100 RepID=A0A1B9GAF0_9TREE|nr:hypothetical protein I302_02852 [Kwoniella bestiolae CBS 10118]OCF28002.1 hypothetical protein I302_02852 [Kwoniella bestiolae CBS 10118]
MGRKAEKTHFVRVRGVSEWPVDLSKAGKLTEGEQKALNILHQLCAFEHIFMEFFAGLDGLKISPVRGSKTLKYDRQELFINPQTGNQARRNDQVGHLENIIKQITRSQKSRNDNLVPNIYLDRLEKNFLDALHNPFFHLRQSAEVPGQVGLFVKPGDTGPPSNLDGIRFELFSLPRRITDTEENGFLDDLTFDYKHKKRGEKEAKNYILIGLGMARVINHHCSNHSVEWTFEPNALKFEEKGKIGRMVSKLVKQSRRAFKPGMEIFGYYGDEFAQKDCICSSTSLHESTAETNNAVPGLSKDYDRGDTPLEYPVSRADSMDLDGINLEGSSPVRPPRLYRTPSCYEVYRDKALSQRRKDHVRRRDKKRKSRHESEDDSQDEVEYVGTKSSPGGITSSRRTRSSPLKQRRMVGSEDEEFDIPGIWGRPREQEEGDLDEGGDVEVLASNASSRPSSPSKMMKILNQIAQLDGRVNSHLNKLEFHENSLDGIISRLVDFKENIREERKEVERCREKQKTLMAQLKKLEKGKGKESRRDTSHSRTPAIDLEDADGDRRSEYGNRKSSMCSSQ